MTDQEIFALMKREDEYQNHMARQKHWKTNKTLAEWILVMEQELSEAKLGYCKNLKARDSVEHEILQVMVVGMNALRSLPAESLQILFRHSRIPAWDEKRPTFDASGFKPLG